MRPKYCVLCKKQLTKTIDNIVYVLRDYVDGRPYVCVKCMDAMEQRLKDKGRVGGNNDDRP